MHQVEFTRMLGGNAASFKVRRPYVQAADMISFLDMAAGDFPFPVQLRNVEFHDPLQTLGVLRIESGLTLPGKTGLNATGHFADLDGNEHAFAIFPSPFPIVDVDRPFDEDSIWPLCELDIAQRSIAATTRGNASFIEHLSSMMKMLCRKIMPDYGHWWFVRLRKQAPLPQDVKRLQIKVQRIVANRFVTADIFVDGAAWGSIDFVGNRS